MASRTRVPIRPRRGAVKQAASSTGASRPSPSRPGEAISGTPFKSSSSLASSVRVRNCNATHTRSNGPKPAAPAPTTQRNMDLYLESEMEGAIFHDPKFVEHFLSGDSTKLDQVLERCREGDAYNAENDAWELGNITRESDLYDPILKILDTIKQHTAQVHRPNPNNLENSLASSQTDFPASVSNPDPNNIALLPDFEDTSRRSIPYDEVDTANLKPDIVLFDNPTHKHWETVKLPIEIKLLPGHHKAGMKQLSRYARAVFAHQLHRRHLYGMMVCGSEATFVRFDRAGILYSPRIDLEKDSEVFTRAFASLLMLDRADEGYDTAFTTQFKDGRLEYFIKLPGSAFEKMASSTHPPPDQTGPSDGSEPRTRTFRVVERLCHRKSICGRATIVLRLEQVTGPTTTGRAHPMRTRSMTNLSGKRKADEMEGSDPIEFVLKITWRDPERRVEGEVMERLQGMFGLAQYVWHRDAPGRCRCPPESEGPCLCVDETAQVGGLQVCDNLTDVAISVPDDDENGNPPELKLVDTTQCRSTSRVRMRRIYSYILMSSVGVPLSAAKSPRQFMTAVLDAILGYWRIVNLGILHRDISEGNVMMLKEKQAWTKRESEESRTEEPEAQDEMLVESEKKLQEVLAQVKRPPTGMLSDFDLHAIHSPTTPFCTSISSTKSTSANNQPRPSHSSRSKRLKTNSSTHVPAPSNYSCSKMVRGSSFAPAAGPDSTGRAQRENKPIIDFRTGTPAFMSIRVLAVAPGEPYRHTFMDDLESFYWVILWSVTAHLDENQREPTWGALLMLNSMNQDSLAGLESWKQSLLYECYCAGGAKLLRRLDSFGNSWASNEMFVHVILELGALFNGVYINPEATRLPGDIFAQVVDIIQHALSLETESSA